jgi:hypothetical protein
MDSDPTDPSGFSTDAPGGEQTDPPETGGSSDPVSQTGETPQPSTASDGDQPLPGADEEGAPPGKFADVAVDQETFYRVEAAVETSFNGVDGLRDGTGIDDTEPPGEQGGRESASESADGDGGFSPSFASGVATSDSEPATPLAKRFLPEPLSRVFTNENARASAILAVGVCSFLFSVSLVTYWYTLSIGFSPVEAVTTLAVGLGLVGVFLAHSFGILGDAGTNRDFPM